jgi:hypothetical protein
MLSTVPEEGGWAQTFKLICKIRQRQRPFAPILTSQLIYVFIWTTKSDGRLDNKRLAKEAKLMKRAGLKVMHSSFTSRNNRNSECTTRNRPVHETPMIYGLPTCTFGFPNTNRRVAPWSCSVGAIYLCHLECSEQQSSFNEIWGTKYQSEACR